MKDCVKLATQVIALMNEEGAQPTDQCATLITALALVVTTAKREGISVDELKAKCVRHICSAIDVLHVAKEASLPAR